jgi:hypothetical protein
MNGPIHSLENIPVMLSSILFSIHHNILIGWYYLTLKSKEFFPASACVHYAIKGDKLYELNRLTLSTVLTAEFYKKWRNYATFNHQA